jgi:sugar phosphate isomerase/epimerase
MKIALGTYALPTMTLETAIPMLAEIGYDGVEIKIAPSHAGSMPEEANAARRKKLKAMFKEYGLSVVALHLTGHLLAENDEQHQQTKAFVLQCAELARDLGAKEPPVVAIGIGGKSSEWPARRDQVIRILQDYAPLAEREQFVLAGEAHAGAAVDRSGRALAGFNAVNSPWGRMHFDIIHMFLAGEKEADSVKALLPITGHTHITDAIRYPDGKFAFALLGKGQLDSVAYVKAMYEQGWNDFITIEVSKALWAQEGYDPVQAAKSCYKALDEAFKQAGVPRG